MPRKNSSKRENLYTKGVEAQRFIDLGKQLYKNGPWDMEDMYDMNKHMAIADQLEKGTLLEPPSCKKCGQTVYPASGAWRHIPVGDVQPQVNADNQGKITGGRGHADSVDNADHEAVLNNPKRPL